jgi:hypothetical protein
MMQPLQARLREADVIEFEGMFLRYEGEWDTLQPGDTYVAERNQGPQLLTVRDVHPTHGPWRGWVNPVETAYSYDLSECVKVSIHFTDPREATV